MSKVMWNREYHGFESISDLARDVIEALEYDMPELEAEFPGKLTITITYEENT